MAGPSSPAEMKNSMAMDDVFYALRYDIERLVSGLGKPLRIRVKAWLVKLQEPTHNAMWKKQRNQHARLLLEQVRTGHLDQPFIAMPPEGQLLNLPNFLAYRYMSPRGYASTGNSPRGVLFPEYGEHHDRRRDGHPAASRPRGQPASLAAALDLLGAEGNGRTSLRRMSASGVMEAYDLHRKLFNVRYDDDERNNISRTSPPHVRAAANAAAFEATYTLRARTPSPMHGGGGTIYPRSPSPMRQGGGGASSGGGYGFFGRSLDSVMPALAAGDLAQGLEYASGTTALLEWRLQNAQDEVAQQAQRLASGRDAAMRHVARVREVTRAELDAVIARFERGNSRGRRAGGHREVDWMGRPASAGRLTPSRGRYASPSPRASHEVWHLDSPTPAWTPWSAPPRRSASPSRTYIYDTYRHHAAPAITPPYYWNDPFRPSSPSRGPYASAELATAMAASAMAASNADVRQVRSTAALSAQLEERLGRLALDTQQLRAGLGTG